MIARKEKFKTVKTGPVTEDQVEPDWIHDLPPDNMVAAITALAGEVYTLRERLRATERELERRDVFPQGTVENHQPTLDEGKADQEDLDAFVDRIWSEISRSRAPWASVQQGVEKYLKQPD